MTPPSPLPTPSPEEENTAKKLVKQAIEKTKSTYANTQVLINHRSDLLTIHANIPTLLEEKNR